MQKTTKVILILMCFQTHNIFGDVRDGTELTGFYFSVGFNISYHFGNISRHSYGPEISIGHISDDFVLFSNSFTFEKFTMNEDWILKSIFNGGIPYGGISSGPTFYSYKRKKYFGFESGLWLGLGLYGSMIYKFSPHKEKFVSTTKLKLPVPFALLENQSQ